MHDVARRQVTCRAASDNDSDRGMNLVKLPFVWFTARLSSPIQGAGEIPRNNRVDIERVRWMSTHEDDLGSLSACDRSADQLLECVECKSNCIKLVYASLI